MKGPALAERAIMGMFAGVLFSCQACGDSGRLRPPFRVLFSNDTTNIIATDITGNVRASHKKGEPFRPEMLEASVDETAGTGVDVHMLQPGNGWVPWWKSRSYPADEHYRWFMEKTGLPADSIGKYMLDGGDLVQVFVDRCRRCGIAPFVSLRLNDYHGNEFADILLDLIHGRTKASDYKFSPFGEVSVASQSRFYLEHPEYRIGQDPKEYRESTGAERAAFVRKMEQRIKLRKVRIFNWAIPEVREHKFRFIEEICENYDIDGFELDFMRHSCYFRPKETTSEQRVEIMTDFVSRVRQLLDRTARPGQKRWLCIRVPFRLAAHDAMGIDLPKLAAAGVDMMNLSCHYITEQQSDLASICRSVPDVAAYLELTYCNLRYSEPKGHRKMTDEQFYTAAHLAYARGAAGVSLFNFVYYRSIGAAVCEPPFHVIKHLGDPSWLARQPQHYFLTPGSNMPSLPRPPFPRENKLAPNKPMSFSMDMAPLRRTADGWTADARLRVQTRQPLDKSELAVRFNGVPLEATADLSEPYPTPYRDALGTPETLRAWVVPVHLLQDGPNRIEVELAEGEPVTLVFIDLGAR